MLFYHFYSLRSLFKYIRVHAERSEVRKMVETTGKVHQYPGGTRFYYKGALGKYVIRKSGVNRNSSAVLARNEAFRGAMSGAQGCPATSGGVPWKQFITNLRTCARNKQLGTGQSKSREYRMKFNKFLKTPRTVAAVTA
jgi:hypothetical protein